MTEPTFDRRFWEDRWSQVLRDHSDQVARRPPNEWLITEVANLQPRFALDAGCGHGSDTLWLAARGWHVTAVDFSATALAHARSTAETVGVDVAERIDWVEGDLSTWTPQPAHYDLVVSLYVHVADSVEAMVQRLAAGVPPGWDPVHGRPPPYRPDDRSRNGCSRSASGLGRHRDRSARSQPLDVPRRRGPPKAHGRDRRRRRHLCAAPLLTSHLHDAASTRPTSAREPAVDCEGIPAESQSSWRRCAEPAVTDTR